QPPPPSPSPLGTAEAIPAGQPGARLPRILRGGGPPAKRAQGGGLGGDEAPWQMHAFGEAPWHVAACGGRGGPEAQAGPRAVWRTTSSRLFRIGVALRGGRRMGRGRGRRRRGGCDLLLHSPPRGRRALAPARPRGRCCHTASSPGSGRHLPLGGGSAASPDGGPLPRHDRVVKKKKEDGSDDPGLPNRRSGAARPVPLGAAAAHGLLPVRTGGETVRARRAARRAARLPRPDCLGLGQRHRSASADGGRKFQDGCARKTGREREREKKIKHKNEKDRPDSIVILGAGAAGARARRRREALAARRARARRDFARGPWRL
ncbi:unnamed protein product, partial [Prorocentrum cordatum]